MVIGSTKNYNKGISAIELLRLYVSRVECNHTSPFIGPLE
jgi:hypothetical protein